MLIKAEHLVNLGIETVDAMYQKQITLIAELYSVAKEKKSEAVLKLLNEYIHLIRKQFAHEEELMIEADFSEHHVHKFEHDKHILDLQSLLSFYEMTQDTSSISTYLEESLTPWIMQHQEDIDLPTAEFLKQ